MASPYKNPELMVIGDSLAQGCRSLSVTAKFCAESYSTVIARSQGWAFQAPSFPRPVLFDLEELVRDYVSPSGLVLIPKLYRKVQGNLDAWRADFSTPAATAGPEWHDNLAISGATLADLEAFRWSASRNEVHAQAGVDLLDLVRGAKGNLARLHLAINSGYVLNPRGKAKYADWNALRWVAERRPRRLLIHMGHNNGLYPIGSNAEPRDIVQTTVTPYLAAIDAIEQATTKDQQLIFLLLPKISSVANLAVPDGGQPDPHGYSPRYSPIFSTSGLSFTAAGMKAMDDGIKAANVAIRRRLQQLEAHRTVRVIDAYDILESNDYKNSRDPKRQIVIGSTTVDNRYLKEERRLVSVGPIGPRSGGSYARFRFAYGGFQSLDGMHPTAVGYAEVALEIMKALNLVYDKPSIRKTALAQESLITRFPAGLLWLRAILEARRHRPESAGGAPLPADGDPHTDTAHTIEALQAAVLRA